MIDAADMQIVTEIVDGALSGPEWDAWLAARPEAAAELELARRVRALVATLRLRDVAVPEGFEARLLERVREDAALRSLLDLGLEGLGQALVELLNLLLGLFPQMIVPKPSEA